MMKWNQVITIVLMLAVVGCSGENVMKQTMLERFLVDEDSGFPASVRVTGGVLIHTTQLFPPMTSDGKEKSTTADQLSGLLSELDLILKEHNSGLEWVAKLNLYVSDPGDCDEVRKLVGKWYKERRRPAITVVSTSLPRSAAKVALDAVAVVEKSEKPGGVEIWSDFASERGRTYGGEALAAVAGSKTDLVYISGRASKADDLAAGTKGTVEELMSVLKILGAGPKNVIQIKAFLNPMSEAAFAAEAIQSFFEEGDRPPVVMVEWTSSSYPTEIEIIAAIPERDSATDAVMYMTPPWDKSSPVYSKVAVLKDHDIIYIGEMVGDAEVAADVEVKTLYDHMQQAVEAAGSDFRHLVKATYYFTDPAVSKELNTFRPTVYDPKRPPTASKISLKDIGVAGRGMLIDMIAVPAE